VKHQQAPQRPLVAAEVGERHVLVEALLDAAPGEEDPEILLDVDGVVNELLFDQIVGARR
jgi:hypothetical protein